MAIKTKPKKRPPSPVAPVVVSVAVRQFDLVQRSGFNDGGKAHGSMENQWLPVDLVNTMPCLPPREW